jgi:hypothetical protein
MAEGARRDGDRVSRVLAVEVGVKQMTLCRVAATIAAAVLMVGGFHADEPKLLSVWRIHDGSQLKFAGQKVAALVITDDQSLQMSGEEALVRELGARGVEGVATYRFAPREELKTAAKARPWFERAGVVGVVAMRPAAVEREKVYSPVVWASGYYQSYWGYYDYGWMNVGAVRASGTRTRVIVETLIFDLRRDKLVWAATSETKEQTNLQQFITDLVRAAAEEMRKANFIG